MNLADAMNLGCVCRTLNPQRLREQLETHPSLHGMAGVLAQTHPHLFSQTAVFLDAQVHTTLAHTIAAIERVFALPGYQQYTLAQAAPMAQHHFGPAGVFMGYDFHISADGPHLIEINTNAGGAPARPSFDGAPTMMSGVPSPLMSPALASALPAKS